MSLRMIEAMKSQRSVSRLCSTLSVSRSGYYAWASRPPCERKLTDEALTEKTEEIHAGSASATDLPRSTPSSPTSTTSVSAGNASRG